VRVLYVSHTAVVSGGERSLLDLLAALPGTVEPLLATPPGPLQALAEQRGIATTPITGTAGSLRLHPAHTPRALAEMALAAIQVRRAAYRHGADLVHANSIRGGIVLALARLGATPAIVHVRDCLPASPVSTATLRLIGATARTVVANSRYTADSVRAVAPKARLRVVYNAVDLKRFDPARLDRASARARLGDAGAAGLLLGVVGQLTPWKGQDTAIEALGLLRARGLDARLLLVGSAKFVARSTRFDNEDYVARLRALAAAAGVQDHVEWLGEREDVPEILRALDGLLLPSWEEPFGRALIEAMALGVPVLATDVGGPSELIEDGREGYLLPPREPQRWAEAIERVARSDDGGAAMGLAGRHAVHERFTMAHHLRGMLDVYEQAISEAPRAPS
jgi:glycosyltransferase involved in cell wall biosynthesis